MVAGSLRHPRVTVETSVGSFAPLQCTVNASKEQSADTFSAVIPLDTQGSSASAWASTSPIEVTVMASNDVGGGGMVTMFTGAVDKVEIDFGHRTVHISGRDKTSELIDAKTNEKFLNKKPQEIIQDLAGRAGLGVQFSGKSGDKAGLKYKDDYNRITDLDSHWNVIVRLANQIGCVAYVKGGTLFVEAWDQSSGGSYQVTYRPPTAQSPARGSIIDLMCSHDLHLAKDVTVNVKSYQHKEGESIESEFSSGGSGGKVEHNLEGPNLTKKQADEYAQNRLNQIISQQRTVSVKTFGDVSISPQMMLNISGTGTACDGPYVISDIAHNWSQSQGYEMSINARNKDSGRGGSQSK